MGASWLGSFGWLNNGSGGSLSYSDKVKALFGTSLVGYWMLDEASGTTADNYEGTAARDGTYTAVTLGQTGIGDGKTSASFDGATSICGLFTASLTAAYPKDEGSVMIWASPLNAGVWTDGAYHVMFCFGATDANTDYITTLPDTTLLFSHRRAATSLSKAIAPAGTVFKHYAMTWSLANNRMRPYLNGVQQGVDLVGTDVFSNPDITRAQIGAWNATPELIWKGTLAHCVLINREATAAEILAVATL